MRLDFKLALSIGALSLGLLACGTEKEENADAETCKKGGAKEAEACRKLHLKWEEKGKKQIVSKALETLMIEECEKPWKRAQGKDPGSPEQKAWQDVKVHCMPVCREIESGGFEKYSTPTVSACQAVVIGNK